MTTSILSLLLLGMIWLMLCFILLQETAKCRKYGKGNISIHLLDMKQRDISMNSSTVKLEMGDNFVSEWDMNGVFLHRLSTLRSTCLERKQIIRKKQLTVGLSNVQFFSDEKLQINYCKVPKAGSTFWMYFFMIVKGMWKHIHTRKARYEVHNIADAKLWTGSYPFRVAHDDIIVLVARSPYDRLFSAYIDKIYIPLYRKTSQEVAKMRNRKCYGDVTFDNFLTYITVNNMTLRSRRMDRHWSPIYYLCFPCHIPYNRIIKSENFTIETSHILKNLRLSHSDSELLGELLTTGNIAATVRGKVIEIFRMTRSYKQKCLTFLELMERVWISFKVQGYICEQASCPAEFRTMSYYNVEETIDLVMNAVHTCNMTKLERDEQRRSYLVKAYRSVRQETIAAIKREYIMDFTLFDYYTEPP